MCQSIPGYFSKGGILYVESWDDTKYVIASQEKWAKGYMYYNPRIISDNVTICDILGWRQDFCGNTGHECTRGGRESRLLSPSYRINGL